MSKIFYDHLIIFEKLDSLIKESCETCEEKEELWNLIDEIIHHRVLGCVLDKLAEEYHYEFLTKYHSFPFDDDLFSFADQLVEDNLEKVISREIEDLEKEIIEEIFGD